MKYLDEFRDAKAVQRVAKTIEETTHHPWNIMEVCGGQTHSIVRYGLDRLLPQEITLIHGPGCPVCVTPIELIDIAIQLAGHPDTILCSFGDMLRVPGSHGDLLGVKAQGGDIRIVYSPLDALDIAQANQDRQVVSLAVGFETTAPTHAMAILQAQHRGLHNYSMIVSHVLVPPAMEAILSSPGNRVQGFLAAGHVCTIMGYQQYEPLAERYKVPIVVTGFEPLDIMEGISLAVSQLEAGEHRVENQYTRSVQPTGNLKARRVIEQVFEIGPRTWRGIGEIPESGLRLTSEFAKFDALQRFADRLPISTQPTIDHSECQSGLVLQGRIKPSECSSFGTRCTPEHPLGAPMVSSEGACAAYYRFRSHELAESKS
jgi:hydrogenase expression/formation protein HypD